MRNRFALVSALCLLGWMCLSPLPASAQLGSLIVTITSPASGSTVSGTTTVSASVIIIGSLAVAGVQFKLDGVNLGAEDTSEPYQVPWNTTSASNGSHTLTAVARDILGGRWTSDPVTVNVSNPPTITGFSPTSGPVGTSITISGMRFTGATTVRFNGTSASYTVNSATSISATVPSGATTGPISVTTSAGTGTSSSNFTVIPPPTISSFSPTSGGVGTTVTISGTNFTGATAVRFNGTSASFTVNSATSITATVPSGATTGPITVTTPGGTTTSASSFTVTASPPTIGSFSPTSGSVGTNVTISGTNFTGATAVRFNGTSATFTVNSATSITATVPSGATTGPISVTTPGGTATSASTFTVTASPPTISSFSPPSGGVGTNVTISGTNFTGATAVAFNGVSASFTVNSATSITATVPSGATTGPISVTTPGGTATSSSNFTVIPPPTISSFSPTSGPVGSNLTISGTNFTGASAVRFNGTNASFTVNSSTSITATVPSGATTGPISVTTPGGTATSSSNFTIIPPPTISSFSPTSGGVGTNVTIGGTNFTGATAVAFNGVSASFTVNSATSIMATVPSGATTGPISVTTPGGTATSSSNFTVIPPPTISSFSPTSGGVGTNVTISGTNFTGATAVTFNGTSASFTVSSATSITATVPTGATTGPISVTTPGGTATSASSFTVAASPPTIGSFSPTSGGVGTTVTISGTNFTGATAVRFNGTSASFTVNSSTSIAATVPGGATTGSISVTTPGGTATSASTFTVTASAPTITSFSPTSGPAGTSVTISGTHFTGATAVRFNGTSASFSVTSGTAIQATVPSGATTGPISVTTPGGTATSASSFTVTTSAPTITSFSPTSGPVGSSVTSSGTNFTGATAVRLNGTSASFTVNSATSISATVPSGATTGPISVTTPGGTATSSSNFTVIPAPTITSFSPTSGGVGTSVAISGTNFTGATAVRFNGTSASFTVNSSTSIAAMVPSGATTGPISVTTPGGTATSASSFTVTVSNPPTITSFTPTSGPVGTTVTISGTNFTGATAVTFNGTSASFTVSSATAIQATVPAGATTGPISVTTPGGTATSASSFTVVNDTGGTIRIDESSTAVSYTGRWNQGYAGSPGGWSGGTIAIGFVLGQRATLSFTGTGVSWIGYRASNIGIANVYLDGTLVATVDGYATTETVQAVLFTASGLTGPHTLAIEVTETKNEASSDDLVVVDAFDVTGAPPDTEPPTVTITSPSAGATVAGTIPVTADAADNVGVVGVRFFVDGVQQVGTEDTISPYSINWDTTTVPDGSHTLTAVARDGAGNTATSAAVIVAVSNAAPPPTSTATRFENTDLSITYTDGCATCGQSPTWFHGSRSSPWSGGTASFNRSAGARATFTFTGTSVSWIGFRANWAGIARVFVDGAFVREVDLYSPTEQVQMPVFTATDLTDGQSHTLAVESTGLKNPSSSDYAVVVDALDVSPASPPPTAGTRFEETAPSTTFTAGWTGGDTAKAWSGGTAAFSATPAERATFTFTGTTVSWIGLRGPGTGIARVHLDGAFQATVDTYSPTEIQSIVYTATSLAAASHRLEIEVTGQRNPAATNNLIVVDAFDVRSRVEDTDPSITYSGVWSPQNTDRNFSGTSLNTGSGTAARSATAGVHAEFAFTGTAVSWIGAPAPWAGRADVSLDGSFVGQLDLYAPNEQVQVPVFTAAGLAAGTHTLRIDVTGQQNPAATAAIVTVDAFDVPVPAPAPSVTRVQETDPSIAFTAGWVQGGRSSLWSGEDSKQTTTAGTQATFTFAGTSVRWIGERGFATGLARVSLDGIFIGQVDTRTFVQVEYQTVLFSATGLTPGTHTLTIEAIGRNNEPPGATVERVVLDAFDVY